ncbi:DUF5659 domain-containing protein [Natranaerobius thermophilus]|uniref:DUF5659 domain-containing protein n=1 Tax=Natranaerobius thermophilus (strain ATCC BAA-1301 / DSM 18059 / JW/NM-WN-LF) TaxID=457570 RepID=B2A217_NATTJ|nr:DUF5659 domain-containing protein [Natranaerobius thermophilus]ACB84822.1 hypothetical protein Nther_1239 [Natranaerobius thermophilus JW/NM-WN-LF]
MNENLKVATWYVVRSQRLAGFLMLKGFVLKKLDISREDPSRNVFLFNNTKELRDTVELYKEFKDKIFR